MRHVELNDRYLRSHGKIEDYEQSTFPQDVWLSSWLSPSGFDQPCLHYMVNFSNSLIIHHVKTKKITSVKDVWIPGLNQHRFGLSYFSVYSLVFVSIEEIYQPLETVFHRLSKHLEFRQKYSAARRIFNSLLGVWISR